MQHTQQLLIEHGAITFTNAFVTSLICCISPASILTGRYMHNAKVFNNTIEGNYAAAEWQQNSEIRTYATVAHNSGYQTYYAGKYLNEYGMD